MFSNNIEDDRFCNLLKIMDLLHISASGGGEAWGPRDNQNVEAPISNNTFRKWQSFDQSVHDSIPEMKCQFLDQSVHDSIPEMKWQFLDQSVHDSI
jgi:hypothetical protein